MMIYRNQALKMNLDHHLSSSCTVTQRPSSVTSLSSSILLNFFSFFSREDFRKSYDGNMVEASRICFTVWKNMSGEVSVYSQSSNIFFICLVFLSPSLAYFFQDQRPFIARAVKVDLAHNRKLKEEVQSRMYKVYININISG